MSPKENNDNQKKIRIDALDIARGTAVIFMIAIHVQMVYSTHGVSDSIFGYIIEFVGGPLAAPVFMFIMGASFPFSRKTDTLQGIKHGITITLSGYLLNLIRGVIPAFIYRSHFANKGIQYGIISESISYSTLLLLGDILQFAGIALILLTLFRKFKVNSLLMIFISIMISLISPYLWKIKVDVPIIGHITDLFWGDKPLGGIIENSVSFPAFPWLIFPFVGIVVGRILKRSKNINRTIWKIGLSGVVILIPGVILLFSNFDYHFNDYYHARFGSVWSMIGIVFIWLLICQILARYISRIPIIDFLYTCSRNVTPIYSIQWVLITWTAFLIPVNTQGTLASIVLICLILLLSYILSLFYRIIINKFR